MGLIALLLSFYKDVFSIKLPMKVDIPLNKETKSTCPSSGCAVYLYILSLIICLPLGT